MSRPSRKNIFLSIAAIAALIAAIMVFQRSPGTDAAAQGAGAEMPPMPVPVVTIAEKPLQIWKEFSGRLMAVDYVEIRPQVSGIITEIHFEDGQTVKQGDLLFTIDPRPYEAAVAQARAELAAAQDEAKLAQKELARAEELLKTGAISKQGYDERVNASRVNKSGTAGANARLKAAQVDLEHASIKAPIGGRISRAEITQGNLVNAANAPLLSTIVSDADIYGDFEVDEQTYMTFVRRKTGQTIADEKAIPVRLVLSGDDRYYNGVIRSFDNKINPSTGTIRARAVFANEDGALLPGMFAKIQIGSAGQENRITVPEKAVLTDQSRKFVYVVTGGAATYREVKLGDTIDNDRIVLEGLQPGDKVIIENLMKIRPGAKVHAMSAQEIEAMKAQMAGQAPGAPAAAPAEDKPGAEAPAAPESADPAPIPFEDPAAAKGEAAPDVSAVQAAPSQE